MRSYDVRKITTNMLAFREVSIERGEGNEHLPGEANALRILMDRSGMLDEARLEKAKQKIRARMTNA